ncbi:hypothetical protein MRB53_038848 [Persea americana]|nr:hypothetical protein MRB53_038848 [Persea americana]
MRNKSLSERSSKCSSRSLLVCCRWHEILRSTSLTEHLLDEVPALQKAAALHPYDTLPSTKIIAAASQIKSHLYRLPSLQYLHAGDLHNVL